MCWPSAACLLSAFCFSAPQLSLHPCKMQKIRLTWGKITCPGPHSQAVVEALPNSRARIPSLRLCCPQKGPTPYERSFWIHLPRLLVFTLISLNPWKDTRVCLELLVLSGSTLDSRSLALSLRLSLEGRLTWEQTPPLPLCDVGQAISLSSGFSPVNWGWLLLLHRSLS